MIGKEEIDYLKREISVEYFETFEPDVQLKVINRLKDTIMMLSAIEDDFPPKHMDSLTEFLYSRLDELQIIYNMKTNRKLDEFFR
jgi:hypothetical protein